ncbi:hypothetical protein WS67_01175 [Burkholderia singularis]|uniref:Uncharacterized protein n=1 Tax=Burkholderia singularis TaxID=1503053 RepID=A0A103DWU9_9BURK|nr:hypothetical protein [Burkholderia singularis]KVE24206.1 hypothetical protein WS67_01175 [Burkholderia singularis]
MATGWAVEIRHKDSLARQVARGAQLRVQLNATAGGGDARPALDAEPVEAELIDAPSALAALARRIGLARPVPRPPAPGAAPVVWRRGALRELERWLTACPAERDSVWCLRQLDAVLALIARWPAFYPPAPAAGVRRAEPVPGCLLDYRVRDARIEILTVIDPDGACAMGERE